MHISDRLLRFESLEKRNLLAAGVLDNEWIGVLGTKGDDEIFIMELPDGVSIEVIHNGQVRYFGPAPAIAIRGLAGDDTINIHSNITIPVVVEGGRGNDWIDLGSGNDVVLAGAGHDTIFGNDGIDVILGEAGNDTIFCGEDNDLASGGRGADAIFGGDGDDLIDGDAGNDAIYGELGSDGCAGMAGNDLVDGGAGEDDLLGHGGNDSIFGGLDDDRIDGGAGKDRCEGNGGDDRIKGGSGVDFLDGGAGDNLLDKDAGKDQLFSGLEADLDMELFAEAVTGWGPYFTARYDVSIVDGAVLAMFRVGLHTGSALTTHDVVINNQVVGQITTNEYSYGELVFSTTPVGNELPFPADFPRIRPGTKLRVGTLMKSAFVPDFLLAREVVAPQLPL